VPRAPAALHAACRRRRAINLITGDTFWEPVIGRKPVKQLTGYRFTSLVQIRLNKCTNYMASTIIVLPLLYSGDMVTS